MSRTITGPLEYADGTPIPSATITLQALHNNYSADGSVFAYTEYTITVSAGAFSVAINEGDYRVWLEIPGTPGKLLAGTIAVETGSSIELGQLIELSRDLTADLTDPGWATETYVQTYVAAYVVGGGAPGDIPVTSIGLGTATAEQIIRVNDSGTALIGEDKNYALAYYLGQI